MKDVPEQKRGPFPGTVAVTVRRETVRQILNILLILFMFKGIL